jgi:hypothetical protein
MQPNYSSLFLPLSVYRDELYSVYIHPYQQLSILMQDYYLFNVKLAFLYVVMRSLVTSRESYFWNANVGKVNFGNMNNT